MFEDLWNLVVNGEIEQSFKLVDCDVQFQCELGTTVESVAFECKVGSAVESGPFGWEVGLSDETEPEDFGSSGSETEDFEVGTTMGMLEGRLKARSDVYVSMKVSIESPQLVAEAGWRAEYAADFALTLLGKSELTLTENLWEGLKTTYKFGIGYVPVWLDVQPKLNGEFKLRTYSENGVAKMSVGKFLVGLYLYLCF